MNNQKLMEVLMKVSLTLTCGLALLCLAVVSTAIGADVPGMINVQGKLADNSGQPVANGPYSVVFTIYNDSISGSDLWHETRSVDVTDGLFSILLGQSVTILPSLFDDTALWLGMKVGADPEMTPRQRLTTSPYAFRTPASVAGGGWVDDGHVVRLETSTDSVGIGTNSPSVQLEVANDMKARQLSLGSPTQDGRFNLYRDGSAAVLFKIYGWADYGGTWETRDELGNSTAALQPDYDGDGGFFMVYRSAKSLGFIVDGNYNGTHEPYVVIDGSTRAVFNMSLTGDACVSLPDSAISADEILDEPGIAEGRVAGSVNVTGATTMIDIVTVTIDIPAPGYVVLEASAQARLYNTTSANYMSCQIDTTAGGAEDYNYYYYVGFATPPNTLNIWLPVSMRRTYYETSAGSYTYRFEARDVTSNGNKYMWNAVITATYTPTSYAPMMAFVSASEAAQFEHAEAVVPASNGLEAAPAGEIGYRVDLRELEMKVARLKSELEKAQHEFDEAEARKQEERLKE
jgi:hypothetical protein